MIANLMEKRKTGIFYGYVILVATFFILAVAYGSFYTFGVFFKPLATEFGWTRAITSGAFSLKMFLHGFLGIVTGRLNDRFGPRLVITASALFVGTGYLLMAHTKTIWQLYLFYGVLLGIGMSAFFVPLTSTVARWFTKRRGLMTGLTASGVGFGTIFAPPIASHFISSYGWRNSYTIIGITALVAIILAAQFLKRDPGKMGLTPYGESEAEQETSHWQTTGLSLPEAIRTKQFWILCGVIFCFSVGLDTILVHIVPHTTEMGISTTSAATILAIIGGASIVGRIILGSASDRIGCRLAIFICFVLMTAAWFWLLVARETWMFYLFATVYGFAYGGFTALESPIVAELFGLSSHGLIFGCVVTAYTSGCAVGPTLAGRIFDVTHRYHLAFLISAVMSGMAIILSLFLKPPTAKGGKQ